MPVLDVTYIKQFRGFIGWSGFTNGLGQTVPPIKIELFLNNVQLPIRKAKISEQVSVSQLDPTSGQQTGTAAVFYGTPDMLQLELTGWMITLQDTSRKWIIKDDKSPSVALDSTKWGNVNYAGVVESFLAGYPNMSAGGAPQRKDPDYYISPNGHQYTKPIISSFTPTHTVNAGKQAFQMVLVLET